MGLSDKDALILAYFLSEDAPKMMVDGRIYRREEFIQVFADRIFFATQALEQNFPEGFTAVATFLVDRLIAENALTTINEKLSGRFHQFDRDRYRAVIKEMADSNAMLQASKYEDPESWSQAFRESK